MSRVAQTQATLSGLVEKILGSVVRTRTDSDVVIRPVSDHDIKTVAFNLNPMRSPETHMGRFDKQRQGALIYLIAWEEGKPIGHAQLIWDGPLGSPKQHLDTVCPYIEDLWVEEKSRSKGVGTALLSRMEQMARDRECAQIGLSVGLQNFGAIKLYERLGFVATDTVNFVLSGAVSDANGEMHFWSEECQYMRKPLKIRMNHELHEE